MKYFFSLIIVLLASNALAKDIFPSDLLGTTSVAFVPMQSQGTLEGCSLVFDGFVLDHVYNNGAPYMISGSVVFYANPKGLVLTLKLGTTNVLDMKPSAPYFAYLQTDSANTSKLNPKVFDGEKEGYRLFVYPIEGDMLKVYGDMVATNSFTLGFNRIKGGMDLMLPIDLTVKDVSKGINNERIHSPEMMKQFLGCTNKLINSVQAELEKTN